MVILGGGPIGLMIALAAKAAGAGLIAISEVSDYRLLYINKFNFIAIDSKKCDVREEVMEITDGAGADIVFEAAGVPATSEQMTQILHAQGTAVIAGLYSQFPKVDLNDLNFHELTIKGTTVYTDQDFAHAVQTLPVEPLQNTISHRLPLEDAEEGFRISETAVNGMKVLITP